MRLRQLVQLGLPAVPGRGDVPHPSLFNFQAPQSTKPLQKNGSVLGSSLQDDKPVKRLDGPLRVVSLLSPRAAGAPRWSVRVSCLVPRRCCLSVCLSAGARGRRGLRVSLGNTKTQRRGGGLAFGAGSPRHLQPQTGSEGGTLPSFAPALCRRLPSLPSCSWCQPEKRGKARSFSPSVLAVL